jgi:signal transduction histidine kinase
MNKMLYFSITGFTNCAGAIVLSLFVYFKNPKSKINILCSITTLAFAFWSFGYIFWPLAATKQDALFWFRILHCGANFISITLFHFIVVLLNLRKRKLLIFGYILSSLVTPFIFTPYFLKDMRPISIFPYWGVPGPMYYIFLANFFLYASLSIILLYQAHQNASDKKRNQLKYLLIGIVAGYFCGSSNYLLFFGIPLPPYLNGLSILLVISFAYAIVAHNLLDINFIFRKTIMYSVLATIITMLYFGIILICENVFRIYCGYKSFPLSFFVLIFFLLLFQPLKNHIQRILDKYFFRGSIAQIDEENVKLRDELQKTEKLKAVATLAAGMAHEIKNPLTSIKTFTEYIDKKKDDPEFMKKYKQIVSGEVDRIDRTVRQLLDFSKPSELRLKSTDINLLLEETLSLLSNDFLKHNIRIVKRYAPLPPISVDPAQMKQVFLNLLLNAIDSMKSGGNITVKTEIKTRDRISIEIKDAGKGIGKADLKHIFDPFFSKKDGGTGLGLSVVHGIIEKHGGKIEVESHCGKGTSFSVVLPIF